MGRRKYKQSDKCKTKGCKNSLRVKGFCVNCYQNYQVNKQLKNNNELMEIDKI